MFWPFCVFVRKGGDNLDFSYHQHISWKGPNIQWIDPTDNYCLYSLSLIYRDVLLTPGHCAILFVQHWLMSFLCAIEEPLLSKKTNLKYISEPSRWDLSRCDYGRVQTAGESDLYPTSDLKCRVFGQLFASDQIGCSVPRHHQHIWTGCYGNDVGVSSQ